MFLSCVSKKIVLGNFSKYLIKTRIKLYTTAVNKIVRSPVADIKIPNIFLDDFIWKNLNKWKNKVAVQCAETGRSYLYSEVYRKSHILSNFIRSNVPQLQKKDTIAIILPNVPEYPIILLGLIQAGFKVTTVNANYKQDEIYKQLLNSEVRFVFTINELWPEVKQAIHRFKPMPVAIVKRKQDESIPAGTLDFNEMVENDLEVRFPANRSTDDVILIPYSSGTTGLPKGVELTHKNVVANLYQITHPAFKFLIESDGTFQDILPAVLPLYHLYGLVIVLLQGLATGCKLVLIPKFNPAIFIHVLEKYNPTVGYVSPPIMLFLLNNVQVYPSLINQMRIIGSSAAPLGLSDMERLITKSGGKTRFLQLYGLTETSPATHLQTTFFENGAKIGGAGLTLPNTECVLKSLDEQTSTSLEPAAPGEVLIRGPQIMKGYYNNPKATNATIDTDGWLQTGDVGYFDKDGHLFITDRIKELIKVKGFQVAPAELEELLRAHPNIEDAAVTGVPNSKYGEVPKAFIVLRKNTKLTSEEIRDYVAKKVAPYKQLLGGVVIIDSIPKSPTGKILRRLLKDV